MIILLILTDLSLVGSWQREGEIDKWFKFRRSMTTVKALYFVLQLSLEGLGNDSLERWGVAIHEVLM